MKTREIIAIIFCFFVLGTQAQFREFQIGGRFGVGQNNTTYNEKGSPRLSSMLFISGGVATNYQFNRFWGINTDILISQKSTEFQSSVIDQNTTVITEQPYRQQIDNWYLDIPVTGQLSFRSKNFGIRYYVGPQIGFNLVSTQTREYENEVYQEGNGYYRQEYRDAQTTEYALLNGFGIFARDNGDRTYFIDLRMVNGFSYYTKIAGEKVYNDNLSVSAGCMF